MNKKICKECNIEQNENCFALKTKEGRRSNICKNCDKIKKLKYTCSIPSDTKICSNCKCIASKKDFVKNKAVCTKCRVSDAEAIRRDLLKQNLKRCISCNEIKNLDLFRKRENNNGEKLEISYCKVCENKRREIKRKRKLDKIVEISKEYVVSKSKELKEVFDKHRLKKDKARCKVYGLDVKEYYRMVEAQNNKCYICNKPGEENQNHVLYIDHCHNSLKVRKLLCHACNTALGIVKDDLEYIQKLVDYIKEHQ